MFDVLIKDGHIIDGTGNPWFYGHVGIQGNKLYVLSGDARRFQATREIDASGCVVCPGFIDCHTHSDLLALSNPLHEAKVMQGVTTELLGGDGIGYAPLSRRNLEAMKLYFAGGNGNPRLDMEWSSVAEYLRCFHHSTSVNVGFLIPNGAIRLEVVGWDDRAATEDEIKQMQTMVRKGMEEGALGLSSGLDYALSIWADESELIELCKVVAEYGGVYATHVRYSKGDKTLDGFKEAVEIGRRSGCAVNITHFFCLSNTRGQPNIILEIIDSARDTGVDITFDSYPYPYGSGTLVDGPIPLWALIGGPDSLLERLTSKKERQRMREHNRTMWDDLENWNQDYWISGVASEGNKWCEGLTLAEIAGRLGKDVMDAVCDLLLEERLQVSVTMHGGDEKDVMVIMQHPAGMVCSDGVLVGEMLNPRTYGTFPKVIRWLVREEGVLTLEKAISKMTSLPANRYGFVDRGILRDGMKADIVVLDPKTVADKATVAAPKQYPIGIEYVFVNGKLVVEKGKHTGAMAGESLTMRGYR